MIESGRYLIPVWPAAERVGALVTLRAEGHSQRPYDSFNLAGHVGDSDDAVRSNRQLLQQDTGLSNILWLQQVHGVNVVKASQQPYSSPPMADACWTDQSGIVCAVMTADCLPVLVTDQDGTRVGAAHAGWRGLCDGVLGTLLEQMNLRGANAQVWLGPAIGPDRFEVGPEVLDQFESSDEFAGLQPHKAFATGAGDRLFANLYELARMYFRAAGVAGVYGGDQCTYRQSERYFSYRRDGVTGRMASLIWIKPVMGNS